MTPISIADTLKEEARLLLAASIEPILNKWGNVHYSGSYFLDLMAWNDVDLNFVPHTPMAFEDYGDIVKKLAAVPNALRVILERGMHERRSGVPDGIYFQIKIASNKYPLPWKFDIWTLDNEALNEHRKTIEALKAKVTPETRELVCRIKQKLLTPKGRTPSLSSWHLYQEVLVNGERDEHLIIQNVLRKIT